MPACKREKRTLVAGIAEEETQEPPDLEFIDAGQEFDFLDLAAFHFLGEVRDGAGCLLADRNAFSVNEQKVVGHPQRGPAVRVQQLAQRRHEVMHAAVAPRGCSTRKRVRSCWR